MLFRKRRIYADAASAMPLFAAARRELLRLLDIYGNPSALHKEAVAAKRELEAARKKVAEALGAHADEIVFTSGGTEANNLAVACAKHHAVTMTTEHSSVLEPLRHKGVA